MILNRRKSLQLAGAAIVSLAAPASHAQDITKDKIPTRIPLDEFVKDADLMKALRRGVRAMKARKPSDPLSWFFQASIHGATIELIQNAAARDPNLINVDQKKFWNQCPHFGQASANFLPWHRAYTYYFERILRAHTGEPRFSLPYWDYFRPENYRFPREFGTRRLDQPLDGDDTNPLHHPERNLYFTDWEHWSGNNLPYSQLTPEAVDWATARDSMMFFGQTEREGLAGGIADEDSSSRGRLESFPHDPIHRLVGGVIPRPPLPNPADPANPIPQEPIAGGMAFPPTAGFDPIFYVHHSNLDRLWAEWSLMAGKSWGNFPPQDWFDDNPWTFFDVTMENGQLKPVEVSKSRKEYFDYRKLGVSFKSEDLSKTPLQLPDPIPSPAPALMASLTSFAKIGSFSAVNGLMPERLSVGQVADKLRSPVADVRTASTGSAPKKRILLRINGINLNTVTSTGFDVHLVADQTAKLKRSDPSFLGSIALFRHDSHGSPPAGGTHAGHGAASTGRKPSDTFDITNALVAAGQADPSKLHVVIVPYSLAATVDGQKSIVETNALKFDGIEFLTGG
jgi:hypothetical protein